MVKTDHQEYENNLGKWVSHQRTQAKHLAPDQIERLNDLEFTWDAFAEFWEQNFAALKKFHRREGHARVPARHKEDGFNLGAWVNTQRTNKKELTPDQLKRLNDLGFRWDPLAESWEQNFAALQKFRQREGHCRVFVSHIEDGIKLGQWVGIIRKKKKGLRHDRLKRLNAVGFCWDPLAERWEQNFAALKKFHQREGHCRVFVSHIEDGIKLGQWIAFLRNSKEGVTRDQLKRLNALGFCWDPLAERWEQNFAALKKFHQREGHCLVPAKHKEDGLNLGTWVFFQRWNKERWLTRDRLKRLNALGFVWKP